MGVKLDDMRERAEDYRDKIYKIGSMLLHRAVRPWLYNEFIYKLFGYKKMLNDVVRPAHAFTNSIIEQRRKLFLENKLNSIENESAENIYETKKKRSAMLDTLLVAEANGQIDGEGIREEVDTFTFEGHDTTGAGMVFSILLLANNPVEQEKVYEEIKQFRKQNNGDDLTANDFNNMKYFDRVLKECFRIYPPVPLISRQLTEDLKLGKLTVF